MKRFLLVLVPLALFAQVEIDTVIRLPTANLSYGFFIPELNKLYVVGEYQFFVLDCSTYQLKAQIPKPTKMGLARYFWNWRRQKLYINVNPRPDSTLVIDATADSIIGWLSYYRDIHAPAAYLSDLDRLYKPANDTLYAFDCAADTAVRRILPPVPASALESASWDSVGRKLYLGGGSVGHPTLAVYDYLTDSFTKIIDVSSVNFSGINVLVFDYAHRKAYFGPYGPEPWGANVGILDTEHDTLLGVLPVQIWQGIYNQVAVNERDGKVYLADNDANPDTPDTLWVIDCATDSVLKKVEYAHRGWGARWMRWVPWSNRIYLGCWLDSAGQTQGLDSSFVAVLDCNTDSIIVPGLHLGDRIPMDIQLDPIRERIFVTRADSNTIHVLRDVGYGVAEAKPSGPRPVAGLQLQMTSGGYEANYSLAMSCRVDLSVYDLMGRKVRQLVAEDQSAGQHSAVWNQSDQNGGAIARGVYFIRLDTSGSTEVQKAVVTR